MCQNSHWEKIFDEKFSPLTSTGEIGENFLLAKFLPYTVCNVLVFVACPSPLMSDVRFMYIIKH